MFENLTNKLENIFSKLKSAPSLTEEQVDSGLKEIRLALLEADVALPVTKEFIANVKPKAIGKEIIKSTSAGQMIVKIVYDELVNILGSKNEELNFKAVPPVSLSGLHRPIMWWLADQFLYTPSQRALMLIVLSELLEYFQKNYNLLQQSYLKLQLYFYF